MAASITGWTDKWNLKNAISGKNSITCASLASCWQRKNPIWPASGRKDADPDIERLLEGVAFLTGNLRQKIEDEFPELTHGLIKMLWPNYLRPVPAMTLIEYTPDMDKSSVPVLIPVMSSLQPTPGKSELMKCCPLMLKGGAASLYLHPLPGYLAAARSHGAD